MKSSKERYTDYDSFAWFYDRYWSGEIPEQILSVLNWLLLPMLASGDHILDLCCGTGQIAAALSRRGFQVTGLDGSKAMLRRARSKAPSARFILADARDFRLPPKHQAAISTFDSLNHIMELEELVAAFRNVHAALTADGLFLFDMHMEQGFRLHWREHFNIVEKDAACLVQGEYNASEKVGRYEFTLFRLLKKRWQRSDFSLSQRCYSPGEIKSALKRAGFRKIYTYDAARELGLEDHAGRTFFLARKRDARMG